MRAALLLLLFIGLAAAATDITANQVLNFSTSPFITYVGSYELLGILAAIMLALLVLRSNLGIPALLFGSALVIGIMIKYTFIDTTVGYAALILIGIISGVGVARWVGII